MSRTKNHNSQLIDELFDSISPEELERTKQKMLLAAKIEDAMKAKGWKKKDLIKAMGINSPSIVTRWFSGTHNFQLDTLTDLQTVLGVRLIDVETKEMPAVAYSYEAQHETAAETIDPFGSTWLPGLATGKWSIQMDNTNLAMA